MLPPGYTETHEAPVPDASPDPRPARRSSRCAAGGGTCPCAGAAARVCRGSRRHRDAGRRGGAHAGVAGGADAILIPEIPYDPEKVAHSIRERDRKGARFSIVVCAEGAHPKNAGHSILQAAHEGHAERLGGAGSGTPEQRHEGADC